MISWRQFLLSHNTSVIDWTGLQRYFLASFRFAGHVILQKCIRELITQTQYFLQMSKTKTKKQNSRLVNSCSHKELPLQLHVVFIVISVFIHKSIKQWWCFYFVWDLTDIVELVVIWFPRSLIAWRSLIACVASVCDIFPSPSKLLCSLGIFFLF